MRKGPFPHVILTVFFLLSLCQSLVFADAPPPSSHERTVFIDPGHGGENPGARGPGGTLEKDATLQLARLVSDRLSGQYRCRLSRTDETPIDIFKRTGLANEVKADLFVSLHVSGSYRSGASGFSLYYYEMPAKPDSGARPLSDPSPDWAEGREPWRGEQVKHFSASRQLARFIRNRLGQLSDDPTLVAGADALVLTGAEMPAILFEIGCLANPSEEKKLRDVAYLTRIAAALSAGIRDFLGDNNGISSMDLHR